MRQENSDGLRNNCDSPEPPRLRRPISERLHDWIVTVDHKKLGILYIVYALLFLVIGGIEATIMRIQLIVPHNHFVSPQVFNRMMTMHGTTMIFFVVMPILFGFGTYLIPLMIGARDMAFPRLNAFSFWMTAFGGLLLYFSFIGGNGLYGAGNAPDVGWWAYAPLTSRAFSVGHSTDFWTLAVLVSGIGSIGTAVNFIATILCMRCPGMTLGKMPLAGVAKPRDGRDGHLWRYRRSPRLRSCFASIAISVDISLIRKREVPRFFGCTSSGFSATRRCTS